MKRYLVLSVVGLALAGCYEKETTSDGLSKAAALVAEATTATNSPDVAVKSWWGLKDAGLILDTELCKANLKQTSEYLDKLTSLATPELYIGRSCGEHSQYDRQITNVEVQSDTRSVVTAQIRNITPPEEGAVLDADDRKAKETGSPFRYVLERPDAKSDWKISQVYQYVSYKSNWEPIFKKSEPSTNRWVFEWSQ